MFFLLLVPLVRTPSPSVWTGGRSPDHRSLECGTQSLSRTAPTWSPPDTPCPPEESILCGEVTRASL